MATDEAGSPSQPVDSSSPDEAGLKPNCRVLVLVEQVFQDVVVVSFTCAGKEFRGVLLDASKRRIPCGANIASPPSPSSPPPVTQRHTYIPPGTPRPPPTSPAARPIKVGRSLSRVRLRPRKVLCWRCRNTCHSSDEPQKEVATRKLCPSLIPAEKPKMELRKGKRGAGSMEDLWDESAFGDTPAETKQTRNNTPPPEPSFRSSPPPEPPCRSTPLIKISFGSRGQGTVVQIPPRRSEESWPKQVSAEAAKRALRKAQMKLLSSAPPPPQKHHKKRKKRRRHSEGEEEEEPAKEETGEERGDGAEEEDSDAAMKERCLRQKLSITLKRINASVFMRRRSGDSECAMASSSSMSCDSNESSRSSSSVDFSTGGTTGSGTSAAGSASGRELCVGDVVWGKIQGFPWWPGKVLNIRSSPEREAHVAWFASSTSSRMPCDRLAPFLQEFKARYNRKKRGPYKEAIRQATIEARQSEPVGVNLALALREVGLTPSSSPSSLSATAQMTPRELHCQS